MERTISLVIRGNLDSGEIVSKISKNKAGEPSIIFYSQQKPTGWFDQLKLDVKKLCGIVRSGTEVATKYSEELASAVPGGVKDIKEKISPSFSTPLALKTYLNSINEGSYRLIANGVTTTVKVEIDIEPPLDDASGKKLWNDNDHKILQSLKTPKNPSKYSPYQSSRPPSDGNTSAPASEIPSTAEKKKLPET